MQGDWSFVQPGMWLSPVLFSHSVNLEIVQPDTL